MDYLVGFFTSSLVSYTEKLRSLNTVNMNSPVMHDAVSTQYELLPFLWRSASCISSTNEVYPFPQSHYLTFKNSVVGTGNTVRRGTLLVERTRAIMVTRWIENTRFASSRTRDGNFQYLCILVSCVMGACQCCCLVHNITSQSSEERVFRRTVGWLRTS